MTCDQQKAACQLPNETEKEGEEAEKEEVHVWVCLLFGQAKFGQFGQI